MEKSLDSNVHSVSHSKEGVDEILKEVSILIETFPKRKTRESPIHLIDNVPANTRESILKSEITKEKNIPKDLRNLELCPKKNSKDVKEVFQFL